MRTYVLRRSFARKGELRATQLRELNASGDHDDLEFHRNNSDPPVTLGDDPVGGEVKEAVKEPEAADEEEEKKEVPREPRGATAHDPRGERHLHRQRESPPLLPPSQDSAGRAEPSSIPVGDNPYPPSLWFYDWSRSSPLEIDGVEEWLASKLQGVSLPAGWITAHARDEPETRTTAALDDATDDALVNVISDARSRRTLATYRTPFLKLVLWLALRGHPVAPPEPDHIKRYLTNVAILRRDTTPAETTVRALQFVASLNQWPSLWAHPSSQIPMSASTREEEEDDPTVGLLDVERVNRICRPIPVLLETVPETKIYNDMGLPDEFIIKVRRRGLVLSHLWFDLALIFVNVALILLFFLLLRDAPGKNLHRVFDSWLVNGYLIFSIIGVIAARLMVFTRSTVIFQGEFGETDLRQRSILRVYLLYICGQVALLFSLEPPPHIRVVNIIVGWTLCGQLLYGPFSFTHWTRWLCHKYGCCPSESNPNPILVFIQIFLGLHPMQQNDVESSSGGNLVDALREDSAGIPALSWLEFAPGSEGCYYCLCILASVEKTVYFSILTMYDLTLVFFFLCTLLFGLNWCVHRETSGHACRPTASYHWYVIIMLNILVSGVTLVLVFFAQTLDFSLPIGGRWRLRKDVAYKRRLSEDPIVGILLWTIRSIHFIASFITFLTVDEGAPASQTREELIESLLPIFKKLRYDPDGLFADPALFEEAHLSRCIDDLTATPAMFEDKRHVRKWLAQRKVVEDSMIDEWNLLRRYIVVLLVTYIATTVTLIHDVIAVEHFVTTTWFWLFVVNVVSALLTSRVFHRLQQRDNLSNDLLESLDVVLDEAAYYGEIAYPDDSVVNAVRRAKDNWTGRQVPYKLLSCVTLTCNCSAESYYYLHRIEYMICFFLLRWSY